MSKIEDQPENLKGQHGTNGLHHRYGKTRTIGRLKKRISIKIWPAKMISKTTFGRNLE